MVVDLSDCDVVCVCVEIYCRVWVLVCIKGLLGLEVMGDELGFSYFVDKYDVVMVIVIY